MKEAGGVLMLLGVVLALLAFFMDTTVTTFGSYVADSYVGGGSTYNLGLLQRQMMIFQGGLAAFVAGAFLFGIAWRDEVQTESRSRTPYSQGHWTDHQENETDEERDERVASVRRTDRIALLVIAIVVAVFAAIVWLSQPSSSPATMNVDENLMNVDANLTATNLNAQ
jgi:Ca2+/Na+ antiporter